MPHNIKVLVVGLDGATWDVILPFVREGKLPTFRKLLEEGSWGILKSTLPPVTVLHGLPLPQERIQQSLVFTTF